MRRKEGEGRRRGIGRRSGLVGSRRLRQRPRRATDSGYPRRWRNNTLVSACSGRFCPFLNAWMHRECPPFHVHIKVEH